MNKRNGAANIASAASNFTASVNKKQKSKIPINKTISFSFDKSPHPEG
jgi:hypothetical protein